jgi:outer membrane lipoprotein-sorting protein
MISTSRPLLACALAAAVALSGCGAAGTTGSGAGAGSTAATAESPQQFLARLEAATSEADSVSMKISGDLKRGSGRARLTDDPASSFHLNADDGSTDLIVVDGIVYARDGGDSAARWQTVPAEEATGLADGFTPSGTFHAMREGAKSVVAKGPEELQGTPTTKYELTLDTVAAGAASGVTPSPGTPDTVYSIWVGDDDLMRRVSVDLEGSTLVVDYSGWGEPVEVVAPPADQVDGATTG